MVSFSDDEELLFQRTVKILSCEFDSDPIHIEKQVTGFDIDVYTRTFTNEHGKPIYLTAKEFDLLYFLYCYKEQVFTKEQLYENIWGFHNAPEGNNLTSFIRKLRKRIEPSPDNPQYILTVWGIGYNSTKKNRRLYSIYGFSIYPIRLIILGHVLKVVKLLKNTPSLSENCVFISRKETLSLQVF